MIRCSIPGKFKKDFSHKKDKLYRTDIAVIGDNVHYHLNADGTGVIDVIEERANYVSRKAPKQKGAGTRGERLEQVIAANIDHLFVITSVDKPIFNNKVIDRFLVIAESASIPVHIIINKTDLSFSNELHQWRNLYESIGYNVVLTSAETGSGVEDFRLLIRKGKNLLFGHSGVGKSTLLNKLYSNLELRTGKISAFTDKGIHTTVTSTMLEIENGIFVIDTPGIREIDPFGISKENLHHYFIEFKRYSTECRFNTCTHNHEPECKVKEAVESGEISLERYESYLRLLETVEQDINL